jgi:hypothetical protein
LCHVETVCPDSSSDGGHVVRKHVVACVPGSLVAAAGGAFEIAGAASAEVGSAVTAAVFDQVARATPARARVLIDILLVGFVRP